MEVLFITHKYPPSVGGMENQSFHLIEGVSKEAKVHKIVFDGQGSVWKFYWGLKSRIKKILRDHPGIELIHCNDGTIGVMCAWLHDYTNAKTCVTLHGLDVVFPNAIFQKRLLNRLKGYDQVITVSKATREECLKRGFKAQKVVCVKNGVDHDLANIETRENALKDLLHQRNIDIEKHRFVVSMGRAVKRKGFSWFIEHVLPQLPDDVIYLLIGPFKKKETLGDKVLKILPSSLSKTIVLLFGIPTDQARIRLLQTELRFKNRVVTLGKLPFTDLLSCISKSNVFVMPNIKVEGDLEGFGLVALEACMRGTTVLASGIEGIQDAIQDGKNGYLIEAENAAAWTKMIVDNLDVDEEIRERNKRFVEFAKENYSWGKMSSEYLAQFELLLADSKGSQL